MERSLELAELLQETLAAFAPRERPDRFLRDPEHCGSGARSHPRS